jgi:citrate lyase subunit beta/citryl-CoA lyase
MPSEPLIRSVPLVRSMLFMPATRTELAPKGLAAGADALIFDLEDAVAAGDKARAREQLAEFLAGPPLSSVPVFVRINGLKHPAALADLRAIVGPHLAGVLVPKVESTRDVAVVDQLLDWCEHEAGTRHGHTTIVPVLETAAGARLAFEIAKASPRTAYMGGLGTQGGDVERSLGYRWSSKGDETFVIRSQVLMNLRAAGSPNPVSGMWASIKDIDGLAAFARQNRSIGYEGMVCIHPTHVPIINEAFTPTAEELERDRQLVETMTRSAESGLGATVFDGFMVDEAMAVTARQRLDRYGPTVQKGSKGGT